ncbi:Fis family transcriptional regulator [Methylomonas sp. SURF-2]|uniref:Putative Fis-like DNA-binding protein n=1 Tax=Methylomonas subterranea TaxID=2952225 RepID=A0ABT1TIH4_9GAMM|nr:helix-turn-helix domain-containing protein [Methylomonas sp. SURF-2]MCQ8105260.1 Fis family transcriptional regulator [Methylomonas sp. SURF-2]
MEAESIKISNGNGQTLSEHVRQSVEDYFTHLNGHDSSGLYQLVLTEVEKPLLETALKHSDFNQSKAAKILGLSRSTLRKKLELYGIG